MKENKGRDLLNEENGKHSICKNRRSYPSVNQAQMPVFKEWSRVSNQTNPDCVYFLGYLHPTIIISQLSKLARKFGAAMNFNTRQGLFFFKCCL